jgi:hypothetical protein
MYIALQIPNAIGTSLSASQLALYAFYKIYGGRRTALKVIDLQENPATWSTDQKHNASTIDHNIVPIHDPNIDPTSIISIECTNQIITDSIDIHTANIVDPNLKCATDQV